VYTSLTHGGSVLRSGGYIVSSSFVVYPSRGLTVLRLLVTAEDNIATTAYTVNVNWPYCKFIFFI